MIETSIATWDQPDRTRRAKGSSCISAAARFVCFMLAVFILSAGSATKSAGKSAVEAAALTSLERQSGEPAGRQPAPSETAPNPASAGEAQDAQKEEEDEDEESPWQVRIGERTAIVPGYYQTIDIVVLVPDEATFLEAISMWGIKDGRWPVLIEDDHYTPIFIRRFDPQRVLRLPSVGADTLPTGQALREKMRRVITWTWRHPEEPMTREEAFASGEFDEPIEIYKKAGWTPPGVVLTWDHDPAWPAAVALAAGYGQPLQFLEDDFGRANDTLRPEHWLQLRERVEHLVRETGYTYDSIEDDIETVTIAREIAARYRDPEDPSSILAVTDGLCRREDQWRWGFAGWIYGSTARSVYMAMSSLFIRPFTALSFDTYPENERWDKYRQFTVPGVLQQMQMEPMLHSAPGTTLARWHEITQKGLNYDALFLTSSGRPDRFNLAQETVAYTRDVPIHNAPVWVYNIHSWSAREPENVDTLAGRWLENGAVGYVGAINEPYLRAFVPPGQLALRLEMGTPFIPAIRYAHAVPWKILSIGDPLASFKPRGRAKVIPEEFDPDWPNEPIDLGVLISRQAIKARETDDWAPFFRTARKLARDALALRLYQSSVRPLMENAVGANDGDGGGGGIDPALRAKLIAAVHAVIPAIFHEGELDELAEAIAFLPEHERARRELDMLWSRANPLLAEELESERVVRVLMDNRRSPRAHIDAARLAPAVARLLGAEEANAMLDEALAELGDADDRAEAERLINAARPASDQ